ncbi:hypothetical protein CSC94_07480 [Zhengella mangrovi]|uniref:DNA mimic protein DMP19 C-terminal domain-containing protein n=1 Tax=Zhengella mangrovi TaxID=1982044 RepID=A0A2G1QPY5_9HYPH|nr:hypothetical protein [Zhengella mangrovi]PHP67539.1 hypothetical protein CSC94_07480 [Zhengella mangrovi]
MPKLADLLRIRKAKVVAPSAPVVDDAQLRRRVNSVLSRPTRHDLKPPTLSHDDYFLAGQGDPQMPETASDEMAWKDDAARDEGQAIAREPSSASAPEAIDVPPVIESGETDHTDDVPESAEQDWEPVDQAEGPEAVATADDELETLREKLTERLAALREDAGQNRADQEGTAMPDAALPITATATDEVSAPDDDGLHADPVPIAMTEESTADEEVIMDAGAWVSEEASSQQPQVPANGIREDQEESRSIEAPSIAPEADELLLPVQEHPETSHEEQPRAEVHDLDGPEEVQSPAETMSPVAGEQPETSSPVAASAPAPASKVLPVRDVILPQSLALSDEYPAVFELAVQISDYLMFEAGYFPEELPRESVNAWCMNFLLKNLDEGGLGSFVYNAWGQPEIWSACSEGLEKCGAQAHLYALEALNDLMARDAALAEALEESPEAAADHDALSTIEADLRQAEADEPVAGLAGRWLLQLPNLNIVPDDDLQYTVTALGEKSALKKRRSENDSEAAG